MNSMGRTIARNASVLMASQLITWTLTLLLTIVLPRYLGAANVGKLHVANSLWAIVAVFVTFGMDTLLTKEIARDTAKAMPLFGTSVVLRLLFQIVGFAALIAYFRLFPERYPFETVIVAGIIGFSSLLWQLNGACQAVLQGVERMEFISLGSIAGKAVNTLACIALLLLGFGVYVVASVTVVAAAVTLVIELAAVNRLAGPLRLGLDWREAGRVLRASFPYFMSGVFLVFYMQVDIIIISLLVDERAVGWYGAADQLFGTLLFIPTVFITAVFPALSRLYAQAADALPKLMRKSWDMLMLLAIPIGLGLLVVADPLVVLLFGGEFAPSGPILALMGVVLILTYQNILLGQFLISTDRQNAWTIVMAVTAVITIPLDFIFVPWCQQQFGNGAMGGALSFILTELVMNVVGVMLLPAGSLGRSNVRSGLLAAVAGLAMVAVAWPLRWYFLALPVVAGAVVYVGLILLLRALPPEDLRLFGSLAQGLVGRFRRKAAAPVG